MPENRQQPFVYVPQTGQTSFFAGVESSSSKLAAQWQSFLSTAAGATNSVLNNQSEIMQRQNQELSAMGNLIDATKDLENKRQIVTENNIAQTQSEAASLVSQRMQSTKQNLSEIIDLEQRGVTAYLANHSPEEIKNLINSGQAQNLDPNGYLKLEEQSGVRVAMQDTAVAMKVVHANPNFRVEDIIKEFAAKANLATPVARAAYLNQLSNDITHMHNNEIISLMDQTRVKNTENLGLALQRGIAQDITNPTINPSELPMKFIQRVKEYQTNFVALNPRTASEEDVLLATTKAFQTVVGSGVLSKMAPERLIPMFNGVQALLEKDPAYLPLLGSIGNDIRQQIGAVYAQRGKVIEESISSAQNQTDLAYSSALLMSTAKKGLIDPNMLSVYNKQYNVKREELQLRMNADARINMTAGYANVPMPDDEKQDAAIDKSVRDFVIKNSPTDPQGNVVNPTQSQVLALTLQRVGRITRSQMDMLNTAINIPMNDKTPIENIKAYTDATQALADLTKISPVYMRDLVNSGKLDPKISMMTNLLSNTGNSSVGAVSTNLKDLSLSDISEARSSLAGVASAASGQPVNEKYLNLSDLKNEVADAFKYSPKWFGSGVSTGFTGFATYRADVVSSRAEDGFNNAYMYTYALARKDGKDQETAKQSALNEARQAVLSNYKTYDLGTWFGNNRYVVPNDFPLIAEVKNSPQVAQDRMAKLGEAFIDVKYAAFSSYLEKGKIGIFARPAAIPLTMDMDRVTVEGTGKDAMLVIPLKWDGARLDVTKPQNVFRYPLDPEAQKKIVDDKRAEQKAANKNNPLGL